MTYEVEFTDTAYRQLKKLDRPVQERVVKVLERVRIRPEAYVSKLVGEDGYKLRVGDYRLILDIIEERLVVLVLYIGHRSSVYAKAMRRK